MNDSHDNQNHETPSQNLEIWMCQGCQAVHIKTTNVMLNFTKQEFAELTHIVLDIYRQEFGGLNFYRLLSSFDKDDEVLLSQTIG